MPSSVQVRNAKLFEQILANSKLQVSDNWSYKRLKADGYMDLSIDRLYTNADGSAVQFAMAHNGELNGDVMADPDMEFVFNFAEEPYVVAQHYQNDYAGVFSSVERGNTTQTRLDDFLNLWLQNLIEQGHALPPAVES